MLTTLSAVGKQFSSAPRSNEEIDAFAAPLADMLVAYARSLST